ncbi:MAG: saccharopine dehydrogenase family protein [Mycobacteriaceae bacterium]
MAEPEDTARSEPRELDIVVFGATGFVGTLVAQHLADHAPNDVRIGLAGRSTSRLESVRRDLGAAAAQWPLITADSTDSQSLAALAATTKVVASTVGPYAKYGMPLVRACVEAGTDYLDLTGEVLFVRDAIDTVHATAVDRGVRIVNSCGFDSIPSDLGVFSLFERARSDGEGELTDTTLVVRAVKGGFSGGTIDSLRTQIDAVLADRSLRKQLEDPYVLSPDRVDEPALGDESDSASAHNEAALGGWNAPFVMAPYNTRIVRRSNALQDWAYGRQFRYREVIGCGSSVVAPAIALAIAGGTWAAAAGLAFGPARRVLDRVLPAPGHGPSARARAEGHFRIEIHTTTTSGARYVATVAAKGDPGYAATAVMMGQSALCLATDGASLPRAAGVLTPATAMGSALVARLLDAGMVISVSRS